MLGGDSYGHGVLRSPDPRFMALQKFCETRPALLEDPIIQLVRKVCVRDMGFGATVAKCMLCRRMMLLLASSRSTARSVSQHTNKVLGIDSRFYRPRTRTLTSTPHRAVCSITTG